MLGQSIGGRAVARTPFFGIYPMLYAMFDAGGGLDRAAMRAQVAAAERHGAQGIAVLGLATEVNKLTEHERRSLVEWVAQDLGRRLPLAVTVAEPNATAYVAAVKHAAECGADWVILQPPPARGAGEAALIRFFGQVADAAPVPVAIQNAPEYIGVGLTNAGLNTLGRLHPNVTLLKGEASATALQRTIEETEGRFDVFNGRGGKDLTDSLRAGCVGLIPGFETVDVQSRIFELMKSDQHAADRLFHEVLPLLSFLMESMDHILAYGKRLAARRLGLGPVHDRAPALAVTPFGERLLDRLSSHLGPL
jgi:2-keto-3-deoxy-L-arabinonate dehydratase